MSLERGSTVHNIHRETVILRQYSTHRIMVTDSIYNILVYNYIIIDIPEPQFPLIHIPASVHQRKRTQTPNSKSYIEFAHF